jgi:hypothetical protein
MWQGRYLFRGHTGCARLGKRSNLAPRSSGGRRGEGRVRPILCLVGRDVSDAPMAPPVRRRPLLYEYPYRQVGIRTRRPRGD